MIFRNYLKFHLPNGSWIYLYNNFEISLVVFMPNITTNHAITYTNMVGDPFFENQILKISLIFLETCKDHVQFCRPDTSGKYVNNSYD